LVVDFTLERTNRVREEKVQLTGTVKMMRTAKGELLVSYTESIVDKPGAAAKPQWVGLLVGGTLYCLDTDNKTAIRIEPANGDVRLWLEEKFNPFILLLDEQRARAKHRTRVTRQDEWYTYVDVRPPSRQLSGFCVGCERARAVFMNKDRDGVPKDMPRQLWYQDAAGNCSTFDVRRWKGNAADGPKAEDFIKPEDRPGWQVSDTGWPSLWSAKK
jgi:hypothetical protein